MDPWAHKNYFAGKAVPYILSKEKDRGTVAVKVGYLLQRCKDDIR